MNDYAQRICVYCQTKRHPELQPDGSVVEVKVAPKCDLCVAWGDPRRYCEHDCFWLTEEPSNDS